VGQETHGWLVGWLVFMALVGTIQPGLFLGSIERLFRI
jgi:hypothetical protein